MSGRPWMPEEDAVLWEWMKHHRPNTDPRCLFTRALAQRLRRSRNAVRQRMVKLRRSRPDPTAKLI